jgi:anti-sigma factor ChrR (cupin superfamily)
LETFVNYGLEGINLSRPEEWQAHIPWQPFLPGVEIHRFYGDGVTGSGAALLHFTPGAKIPHHLHTGFEHIFVLTGSQTDELGEVRTGELRIHPPGSSHSVVSESGCIVLAIHERPVSFSVVP